MHTISNYARPCFLRWQWFFDGVVAIWRRKTSKTKHQGDENNPAKHRGRCFTGGDRQVGGSWLPYSDTDFSSFDISICPLLYFRTNIQPINMKKNTAGKCATRTELLSQLKISQLINTMCCWWKLVISTFSNFRNGNKFFPRTKMGRLGWILTKRSF